MIALFLTVALGVSSTANAALVSRLGGLAVYDTDLNITWATYSSNVSMHWADANTWATNLVLDGVSGWRLPTTLQPDPTCSSQMYGISQGYNCTGSEMGHLFYTELGGVAGSSILTNHNANLNLFNNNFVANIYLWSGTDTPTVPSYAMTFYFGDGGQTYWPKNDVFLFPALAVHPGDVAAVPLPGAVWLFGSGLLGLMGVARRKKASDNVKTH